MLLLCAGLSAWAQAPFMPGAKPPRAAASADISGADAPSPPSQAAEPTVPPTIPIPEVPRRAEAAEALIADLEEDARDEESARRLDPELGSLTREIDSSLAETRKTVNRTASIDTLRRIERRWAPMRRRFAELSEEFAARASRLEAEQSRLDELQALWRRSAEAAQAEAAPEELLRRMREVAAGAAGAHKALAAAQARAQAAQNRVLVQEGRLEDALSATRRARQHLEANVFRRDTVAFWGMRSPGWSAGRTLDQARDSIQAQGAALAAYAERHLPSLLLHAVVFALIAMALRWIRRRPVSNLAEAEARPAFPADIVLFRAPLATALLLTVLFGFRLYGDGPLLLMAVLAVLALAPAVAITRHMMERKLRAALFVLAGFLLVDQLRLLAAPVELLPRALFLLEMLAAAVFAAWLMRRAGRRAAVLRASMDADQPPSGQPAVGRLRMARALQRLSALALCFALAALVANALGYAGLSGLIGNALSAGAYVALIFHALVGILEGVFALLLHVPPLSLLAAVRRHRALLRARFARLLRWLAVAGWVLVGLNQLALRERLFEAAGEALSAQLRMGALAVSAGDVLAFVLTLWAALLVSRFVRFLLEEDVYPRLGLARGLPYAISTMLNYTIVIAGFLAGVAALGLDMTKFTILAGAFSVGIGFGLQNVFNNFVSGIILLFERPVKVGDVIEIDANTVGRVDHIGIRASTVRTSSGPDIIVPNGMLISGRVVNWTFSNRASSILLPVALPVSTDLKRAIEVLERSARAHPMIVDHPAPSAVVVRLGPDFLGLELRAWTDRADSWKEIRSELAVAASAALAAEGMALR